MAWVRNNSYWPAQHPTLGEIPGRTTVGCNNFDIVNPEAWPVVFTMSATGDLDYALDADVLDDAGEPTAWQPDVAGAIGEDTPLAAPDDPQPPPYVEPVPDTLDPFAEPDAPELAVAVEAIAEPIEPPAVDVSEIDIASLESPTPPPSGKAPKG